MKHIKSIAQGVLLGSAGALMMASLTGCESSKPENTQEQSAESQNKFLVIEELENGKYQVVESMPTDGPSRAIIREKDENGTVTERFMSEAELKELAAQEAAKVQEGSSELNAEPSGAGMGLAGTILAAAAGALVGNMIANALMNNKNFAANQRATTNSAYNRSSSGGSRGGATTSSPAKKSYFGGSGRSSSPSGSSTSSYGG